MAFFPDNCDFTGGGGGRGREGRGLILEENFKRKIRSGDGERWDGGLAKKVSLGSQETRTLPNFRGGGSEEGIETGSGKKRQTFLVVELRRAVGVGRETFQP